MSSECKKCDCRKEEQKTENKCTKENSCLEISEVEELDKNFEEGIYKKGSSGSKKFSNRLYVQAFMKKLYSKDNPERAECARQRKCILRPFKNVEKKCCNGMTGHHIVPESSLKKSLKGCYNHNEALTTCCAGETNHKGLHGEFHKKLRKRVRKLRKNEKEVCQVKYPKMLDAAVGSFTDVTGTTCDEECIKIALKSNLAKQCKGKNLDNVDVDAVWGNGPGEATKNAVACTRHRRTANFSRR